MLINDSQALHETESHSSAAACLR